MQTMIELYEQQLEDMRKMIRGVLQYPNEAAAALPELHRAEERLLAQLMKMRGESGQALEETDAEG